MGSFTINGYVNFPGRFWTSDKNINVIPVVEPVTASTAAEINTIMGNGLCAYDITPNDGTMTNSWTASEISIIGNAGFDNIRIVAYYFNDIGSSPWTIQSSVLTNLKSIIDEINDNGMIALIDYHQPAIKRNNLFTSDNVDRFVSHWGQISNYFSDYSASQVVYELMNEPEYKDNGDEYSPMTAQDWNNIASRSIAEIRQYDTTKAIMVSPHYWAQIPGLIDLKLPEDDKLILSIHYYDPPWMVGQGAPWISNSDEWLGTDWPLIEPMNDTFEFDFNVIEEFRSNNNDLPVTIGEYGTYNGLYGEGISSGSRYKYLNHLSKFIESKNYSLSHWEFNRDFGIWTYESGWNELIKDGILNDPFPTFVPYSASLIYQSDFSSDTDGWSKYEANGGSVSLSVNDGKLVCSVTGTGNGSYDVRVISPSHTATNGHIYRVTYTISHNGTRTYTADRLNDRFSSYRINNLNSSGFNRVYTYVMAYDTEISNHVTFLLGGATGIFYVEDVKIEELFLV